MTADEIAAMVASGIETRAECRRRMAAGDAEALERASYVIQIRFSLRHRLVARIMRRVLRWMTRAVRDAAR